MASPSTANLNGHSFESQAPSLSDFQAPGTQEPEYSNAALLSLDQTNLRILQVVGAARGIAAKEIGQKINLSRYAALQRAKKLVQFGFLESRSVSSTKTGIKPTLYFFLAPIVTKEAVETAIQQVGMSQLESSSDTQPPGQNGSSAPELLTQQSARPINAYGRRKRTSPLVSVSTPNKPTKDIGDVAVEAASRRNNFSRQTHGEPPQSSGESHTTGEIIVVILELLQEMTKKIVTLEDRFMTLEERLMTLEERFMTLEESLDGKVEFNPWDLLAILRDDR